ncbi:MAG TPA: adenylate/guanylate cyclase domain-containing protein [Gemmatimonadaceae bacterium]|nr:adenylate/guanylate cyclase domain-containing protein [Gemmatimonadaceae bacterium]
MLYKLVSAETDQSFEIKGDAPLVVGRALNSDIPVFDPTISRRHAELTLDDTGVHVRDLGSSNGTYLNGARIETARVSPGDVVTFGKVAFRLKEVSPTPTPVAARAAGPDGGVGAPERRPSGAVAGVPGVEEPLPAAGTIMRPVVPKELLQQRGGFTSVLRVGTPGAATPAEVTPAAVAQYDRNQQKLETLLKVSMELSRAADVDQLLATVVDQCFKTFEVDGVAVELADERGELVPRISRDRRGTETARRIPRSIARTAVEQRSGIVSNDAGGDLRFGGQSVLMQRVRSTMCAPLIGSEDRVLGVLYVDNVTATQRFGDEDLNFLIAFAGIAGVAIENSQFADRIRRETMARSNFERYFAPSLAARIADSPDAVRLGGEKRPVAVLFSDIRGFTALSETMRPDDMASLLTEYFTEMVECVFRNGGNLDKFIGDAVMAQWGAPIGSPDDADAAMRAALEMMDELDKLNAKWRGVGRPELQIGIGLNFGEAFAGNIGSERRLEFTIIGDTVNTASRLCSAADGGEILASDDMRRALHDPPPLEERPPMELKNKTQPVKIYRVIRR